MKNLRVSKNSENTTKHFGRHNISESMQNIDSMTTNIRISNRTKTRSEAHPEREKRKQSSTEQTSKRQTSPATLHRRLFTKRGARSGGRRGEGDEPRPSTADRRGLTFERGSRGPALGAGNGAGETGGVASTREAPARRCRQCPPLYGRERRECYVLNYCYGILSLM